MPATKALYQALVYSVLFAGCSEEPSNPPSPADSGLVVCFPEERICLEADVVLKCNAAGDAWEFSSRCKTGEFCRSGDCHVIVDASNDGDRAGEDGHDELDGAGTDSGVACTECVPDLERCRVDGNLEVCRADGCAWDLVEPPCECGCFNDMCISRQCTASEPRCAANGSVETCAADGCRFEETTQCSCGCVGGVCVDQVCTSTDSRCTLDGNREVCRADGCGWNFGEICGCGCDQGSCIGTICVPGTPRCTATGTTSSVEVCREDGCAWEVAEACPCGCASNACVQPSCQPNATRCGSGGLEETCQPNGCDWIVPGASCHCGCDTIADRCEPELCPVAGETRCSTTTANLLEECFNRCFWGARP